jgi:hypothetical protein
LVAFRGVLRIVVVFALHLVLREISHAVAWRRWGRGVVIVVRITGRARRCGRVDRNDLDGLGRGMLLGGRSEVESTRGGLLQNIILFRSALFQSIFDLLHRLIVNELDLPAFSICDGPNAARVTGRIAKRADQRCACAIFRVV